MKELSPPAQYSECLTHRCNRQKLCLTIVVVTLLFSCASVAMAAEKSVLFIHTSKSNGPGTLLYDKAFQAALNENTNEPITLSNEYTDLWSHTDEGYVQTLHDFYRQKYSGKHFDLIVVEAPPALRFLLAYGDELFPGTPVVFCLMERSLLEGLTLKPNFTGVLAGFDFKRSLESALRLQPDTRHVVVVGGSSPLDQKYMAAARKEFQQFAGQIEFEYLADLPIEEIEKRVSTLAKHSIVFYVTLYRDGTGRPIPPAESAARVGRAANAPFYSFAEFLITPAGGVGGYLWSIDADASEVSKTVRRILAGTKPQDIPIHVGDTNRYLFDWRQLRRWGIDEAKLPPGSIVRNKEFSVWELYKWRIIGGIALCIFEALLIVLLLISRAKRRQAQQETKAQHRRLDEVVTNVPGLVWEIAIDPDTGHRETRFVSGYVKQMLGYRPEEFMNTTGFGIALVPEEDQANVEREINEFLASGASGVMQFRWRTKDGRVLWVESHLTAIRDENGKPIGMRGVSMDISERKRAETDLQKAVEEVSKLKNQLEEENIYLREEIKLAHDFDQIVGRSDATKYVLFKIEQVAPTDTRVLITGETGTGKELVAHAIHSASSRRDRPLVKVNCAALSPTLIESELFGHEKGAFTGASARKIGRFELANGATIFLDEIGELPLELQAKLLRVIQENEFERLGSSKTIQVDARIIAATNRNLKTAVEQGSFREDLWYRLNVFPITVPPLRDRKEDIPGLVEHFVKRFAQKVGRKISSISPATMRTLHDYNWPGNVRELANVVERAVINTNGSVLRVVDHFEKAQVAELSQTNKTLEEIEKEYIVRILDSTAWRIEGHRGAARILGLNPSTLRTRISKLGIQKSDKTLTSSIG